MAGSPTAEPNDADVPTDGEAAPKAEAAPVYEGMAPGDEIAPEDPDLPVPERAARGEDENLRTALDMLGGPVISTDEP